MTGDGRPAKRSPIGERTRQLLPEGIDPPADVPPEIFARSLATFLAGRRLDMSALASELNMGRATLYRRVGSRDRLLGEVIWYLTRRAMIPALEEAARLRGVERVVSVAERFMRFVHAQPAFRRLLEEEPEASLRILTSKHGPVQGRLVALTEGALLEEEERGDLVLTMDAHTLAYLVVRIGESFLYADVIADNDPDLDRAIEIIRLLLAAGHTPERSTRGTRRNGSE